MRQINSISNPYNNVCYCRDKKYCLFGSFLWKILYLRQLFYTGIHFYQPETVAGNLHCIITNILSYCLSCLPQSKLCLV